MIKLQSQIFTAIGNCGTLSKKFGLCKMGTIWHNEKVSSLSERQLGQLCFARVLFLTSAFFSLFSAALLFCCRCCSCVRSSYLRVEQNHLSRLSGIWQVMASREKQVIKFNCWPAEDADVPIVPERIHSKCGIPESYHLRSFGCLMIFELQGRYLSWLCQQVHAERLPPISCAVRISQERAISSDCHTDASRETS